MKILNIDANPKTVKGQAKGYLTAILYGAPGRISGVEMCKNRSRACFKDCLYFSGRGAMKMVQASRIKKTKLMNEKPAVFDDMLMKEIERFLVKANRANLIPCFRPNGTFDYEWELRFIHGRTIFEWYPRLQMYDYTKSYDRMVAFIRGEMPPNYHLTFSLSEDNLEQAKEVLKCGANVAVVFMDHVPTGEYLGYPIYDGDEHDLRFTDPSDGAHIIGLKAKGTARKTQHLGEFVKESW